MTNDVIIENKDLSLDKTITIDGIPIDRTENTATVSIYRKTDGAYWKNATSEWVTDEGEIRNTVDPSYGQGLYLLDIASDSGFFEDLSPLTEYDILVTWRVANSLSALVYEATTIRTIAKNTQFDSALDRAAYEYDFTTYGQAVMLFYLQDRPLSGDPYAWCYLYSAVGGNPVNVAEISKRDRVHYWTELEPV